MMSSDSNSMKDTDAGFPTESLKTLSIINNVEDVFLDFKVFNSDNSYFFSCNRNAQFTFAENS